MMQCFSGTRPLSPPLVLVYLTPIKHLDSSVPPRQLPALRALLNALLLGAGVGPELVRSCHLAVDGLLEL